jgi:hypothetical protein
MRGLVREVLLRPRYLIGMQVVPVRRDLQRVAELREPRLRVLTDDQNAQVHISSTPVGRCSATRHRLDCCGASCGRRPASLTPHHRP